MNSKTKNILDLLETGKRRAAAKINGKWICDIEVKEAILTAFREGGLVEWNGFVDKENLLPQTFNVKRGIRLVPGGSSVRRGSFIAPGVIIMPPAYVNVGAYVDEGSMIDSHVLVGSCAQIGKRVHLSAGVQIGGVLEPVGQSPVVVEDDAFIGAGSVIVEGVQVSYGAVIAPGVILSGGIKVFDCIHSRELAKNEPIPPYAVVVSGTRPLSGDLSQAGFQIGCALIVKYRDENSNASLVLEEALR